MNSVVERLDRLIAGMVVPLPVESTDVVSAAVVLPIEAAAAPSVKLAVVDPVSTELDSPAADTEQVRTEPPTTGTRRLLVAGVVLFIAAAVAAATWQVWPNEKTAPRVAPGFSSAAHALAAASVRPKTTAAAAKEGEPSTDSAPSRSPVEVAPPPEPVAPPPAQVKKRSKAVPRKSPDCATTLENAERAASNHAWAELLRLTSRRSCWQDRTQYLRLRTQALFERKLFRKCAALGAGSTDYRVKRLAEVCRSRLESSP